MKKYVAILVLLILCSSFEYSQQNEMSKNEPRPSSVIIQEIRDNLERQKENLVLKDMIIKSNTETIEALQANVDKIDGELQESIANEKELQETVIKQNEKLEIKNKWLTIFSIIFFTFFVLHFIIIVLKTKWGITLPYWLNSIL